MNEFVIKPLDESTVDIQVEIFDQAFNKTATRETWIYKHYENPLLKGKGVSAVLGAYSGEILVGIGAFMPVEYSISDTKISAMQACDAAIRRDWQGKGIYTYIMAFAEDYYKSHNFDVLFAFPYPDFGSYFCFKKLGWTDDCTIYTSFIPVKLANILKSKLHLQVPSFVNVFSKRYLRKSKKICKETPEYTCEEHSTPPGYSSHISAGNLLPCYSTEYLNWKLKDINTRYITVSRDGKIVGLFIVNSTQDAYIMAEYIDSDDCKKQRSVLAHLVDYLSKNHVSIKVWITDKDCTDDSVYKKCGFVTKTKKSTYHFMKKVLTEDTEKKDTLLKKDIWKPQQYDMDNNVKLF